MKKLFAIILALVTVASLFVGCGKTEGMTVPTYKVEETMENRQAALVAAAKAYYHKNPYVQYDNQTMTVMGKMHGLRAQHNEKNAPEYASEDLTVYDVCSAYVYDCIYQALGYSLLGDRNACITNTMSSGNGVPQELLLFQYTNDPDNPTANEAKMEEIMAMVQPGDTITYYRYNGTGHTVMYCGDLDGDGKGDILHCDGGKYDFTTGLEEAEENGGIVFNHRKTPSARDFFCTPSFSEYLPKMDRYSLIRPALVSTEEFPITQSAATRMAYPDMAIFYTAECGNYGAMNVDGELTYTLRIKNNGTANYENLLVQIPAPVGGEIVKVSGQEKKTALIKWNVNVPAGQEIVLDYSVKATGGVGSRIVAEGGYVGAIPLNVIRTGVQKTSFDAAAVKAAIQANEGKSGADFANGVWKTLAADAPAIPTYEDLRTKLFARKSMGEIKFFLMQEAETAGEEFAALRNMLVEEYYGGQKVSTMTTNNARVLETRYEDLQAGDVVIYAPDSSFDATYGVFDGEMVVIAEEGKQTALLDFQYGKLLSYDFFAVLRPTQAM